MIRTVLIFLVQVYRYTLSPLLSFVGGPGSGCRFEPTCSLYAIEALQRHGAGKGSWMAFRRICKCHPWGGFGHDPVPPASCAVPSFPVPAASSPELLPATPASKHNHNQTN